MRKLEIKKGDRYGRLVIQHEVFTHSSGGRNYRAFECKCDCGTVVTIFLNDMRQKKTQSCGCFSLEKAIKNIPKMAEKNFIHGMGGTRVYYVWMHMLQRCYNKKDPAFYLYGGRGIVVCDRWKKSFKNFLNDMGNPPEGMSIDRINNNGNYEPKNCRWVTQSIQARNKRNNRKITYNGETLCVSDWSKRLGGSKCLVSHRIDILGWNIRRALIEKIYG